MAAFSLAGVASGPYWPTKAGATQAGKTTENVLRCNDRKYEMSAALFVDVEAFSEEFFGKVEALLREH